MSSQRVAESYNAGVPSGVVEYDNEELNFADEEASSRSSDYKSTEGHEVESPQAAAVADRPSPAPQSQQKKRFAVSTRWEREVAERGPRKDFHSYFCCCARRIGNMFILCEKPDGSPTVVAGPCWPFCFGVTLPLILGISVSVAYFCFFSGTSRTLPMWVSFIYIATIALVLLSLFCVSCRDPGLMERVTDEEAGEGGWFWNEQVGSFRPPGALYCRECGVLIQEYDHLCPWTGTGIGKGNMLAFKAFVVGVNVLCYFSIILVAVLLLRGLVA